MTARRILLAAVAAALTSNAAVAQEEDEFSAGHVAEILMEALRAQGLPESAYGEADMTIEGEVVLKSVSAASRTGGFTAKEVVIKDIDEDIDEGTWFTFGRIAMKGVETKWGGSAARAASVEVHDLRVRHADTPAAQGQSFGGPFTALKFASIELDDAAVAFPGFPAVAITAAQITAGSWMSEMMLPAKVRFQLQGVLFPQAEWASAEAPFIADGETLVDTGMGFSNLALNVTTSGLGDVAVRASFFGMGSSWFRQVSSWLAGDSNAPQAEGVLSKASISRLAVAGKGIGWTSKLEQDGKTWLASRLAPVLSEVAHKAVSDAERKFHGTDDPVLADIEPTRKVTLLELSKLWNGRAEDSAFRVK